MDAPSRCSFCYRSDCHCLRDSFLLTLLGVLALAAFFFAPGCSIPIASKPKPPAPTALAFDLVACRQPAADDYCAGAATPTFTLTPIGLTDTPRVQLGDGNGYAYFTGIPATWTSVTLTIAAPGYVSLTLPASPVNFVTVNNQGLHNFVLLKAVVPPLPPAPTRDQVLKLCMSFQGLNVQTSFGNEPYLEASLAWHDKLEDRQAIYAAKHASQNAFCPNGDTHAMVFVPWGHALYDEGGQFYTADKFPPLDWTAGNTAMDPKFVALVTEVIQNGFIPVVVGAEDYSWVDDGKWDAQASLIVHALQAAPVDLTKYSSLMPGFDGVFYGAANDQVSIPGWASSIRAYCPLCYVVIEHQTGHIPLGEGPSDWASGARMQVYDALYSEFNDDQFDDTVWQIGARTLGLVAKGGAYVRPPDQPAGDDPNAPWYMADSGPRGRLYACAMEFGTYGWVRRSYDAAHVAQQREYFRKVGYTCGG